jgi:hypothetical protein
VEEEVAQIEEEVVELVVLELVLLFQFVEQQHTQLQLEQVEQVELFQ